MTIQPTSPLSLPALPPSPSPEAPPQISFFSSTPPAPLHMNQIQPLVQVSANTMPPPPLPLPHTPSKPSQIPALSSTPPALLHKDELQPLVQLPHVALIWVVPPPKRQAAAHQRNLHRLACEGGGEGGGRCGAQGWSRDNRINKRCAVGVSGKDAHLITHP